MFSNLKIPLIIVLSLLLVACNETKKIMSYSVAEITNKNAREIEELGNFNVYGVVGGKVNLGFIKAFKLCDSHSGQNCIFIISNHTALPTVNSETFVKVKLYKEIAIFDGEFLIFEEVNYGKKVNL